MVGFCLRSLTPRRRDSWMGRISGLRRRRNNSSPRLRFSAVRRQRGVGDLSPAEQYRSLEDASLNMPRVTGTGSETSVSNPAVVVEAASVDDIVAVLKNPGKYPSPVRAVGSNHSTTPCGAADGGTIIQMSKMNQIVEITADTVTAQAGAIYIDVAKEIEKENLQFYVNTEIGSLSIGSAACCGTKDASMPGEYGQVGSYVSRHQDGAAIRRYYGSHGRSARADAKGSLQLWDIRDRVRGDPARASDPAHGRASRDLQSR